MKRGILILITLLILLSFSLVSSADISEPSVCCERTISGASCINTAEDQCDPNFKSSPTSCDTTSYCKLGTCYDSDEGLCLENTPQQVCSDNGGLWDEREADQVPQCQLGCCIIADQAAFVPLVRCKKLSTLYGVTTDYRTDINSELECIATAQSQDMGACVYEQDFQRVCKFTTRSDCNANEEVENLDGENTTIIASTQKKFYKDMLCSAEELQTENAKQASLGCYQGDVYWFDSEGQRENVYSSNREKSYNNGRVAEADEICGPNSNGNKDCGNCEYLLGTRCSENEGVGIEYYCKKTECVDRNGDKRLNGESWCVYDSTVGNGLDKVGSRYFREICVDGEVRVEPCADFRNEICIQDSIQIDSGSFGTAACRVNRWQDCTQITDEEACTNNDRRDCIWFDRIEGLLLGSSSATVYSNPASGANSQAFNNPTDQNPFGNPTSPTPTIDDSNEEEQEGVCVPSFPPGLKFWEAGTASTICGQASAKCIVTYEKGLLSGGWSVKDNEECLNSEWALQADQICVALGDCGGYVNYKDVYTDDGYEWKVDNKKKDFSPNDENKIKGGFASLLAGRLQN